MSKRKLVPCVDGCAICYAEDQNVIPDMPWLPPEVSYETRRAHQSMRDQGVAQTVARLKSRRTQPVQPDAHDVANDEDPAGIFLANVYIYIYTYY